MVGEQAWVVSTALVDLPPYWQRPNTVEVMAGEQAWTVSTALAELPPASCVDRSGLPSILGTEDRLNCNDDLAMSRRGTSGESTQVGHCLAVWQILGKSCSAPATLWAQVNEEPLQDTGARSDQGETAGISSTL